MFSFSIRSNKIKTDPDLLRKLTLLLLHSFFSGIFVSVFFSIANIGFVKNFSSQYIPYGYLTSGLIGFILIQAYRKILKRGGYKAFLIGLIALLLLTILFRGLMALGDASLARGMAFVVFLFAMPFLSLSWLQQSGLLLKTLDYKQTKRYSGLINSGATVASIIGYLLVPQLLPKLANIYDVLFIAMGGILIAILLLTRLKKHVTHDYSSIEKEGVPKTKEKSLKELFKQPYIFYIAICSGISMMAFYLIDFIFLLTSKKSTGSTTELAALLSTFFAGIKLLELVLSLSSANLFRSFGLKLGIFILPLLCLFFSLFSFFSYYFLPSVLFLIAIFALKLFERSVNKSIEEPAYKTLYQLLPENERLATQARIDGGTKQLFIILVGIILILFNRMVSVHYLDIALLLFVIPLFSFWLISSQKLVGFFKKQLVDILRPTDRSLTKNKSKTYKEYRDRFMTEQSSSKNDETFISSILKSKLGLQRTRPTSPILQQEEPTDFFETPLEAPLLLVFQEQAKTISDPITANNQAMFLTQLMSDEVPSDDDLNILFRALKNCKSDYERKLMLKLFEKSDSENSSLLLLELLEFPDYYFINDVIACLKAKNFKCDLKTAPYFDKVLERTLYDLSFVLSLISSLHLRDHYQLIYHALREEELMLQKRIMGILSWKYDVSSLSVIEDALFGKKKLYASANLDIALELLDVLIAGDIRTKIALALEVGNFQNRYHKLSIWYSIPTVEPEDALVLILNYNYNKIGIWTKACALKTMLQFPNEKFKRAVAGYTYHVNAFLRTIAFEYQETVHGQRNYTLLPKENHLFKKEEALQNISKGSELFDLVMHLRGHKFFSQASSNDLIKLITRAEINKTDKKINLTKTSNNLFNLILDGKLIMRYRGSFPKNIFTKNYLGDSMFGDNKITEVAILTDSLFYQIPLTDLVEFILASDDTIKYLEKMRF